MFDWNHFKTTKVYQEAFEEGRQEGKRLVFEQLKQKGIQQWKLEVIPKVLSFGLSIEQIAETLNLDLETVRQAAKQISD